MNGMMRQSIEEPLCKNQPELSLGPSPSFERCERSCSSESEGITSRKRRKKEDVSDDHVELQLRQHEPLPLHWEQCLDLDSGRMYYMNRKTLKMSWVRPKEEEQTINLELNISTMPTREGNTHSVTKEDLKRITSTAGNMMAIACANCHLLVMLSKSSPSCPNCKFMHLLQPVAMPQPPPPRKIESVRSLETLSLLN